MDVRITEAVEGLMATGFDVDAILADHEHIDQRMRDELGLTIDPSVKVELMSLILAATDEQSGYLKTIMQLIKKGVN
jgi:hypothetical protein